MTHSAFGVGFFRLAIYIDFIVASMYNKLQSFTEIDKIRMENKYLKETITFIIAIIGCVTGIIGFVIDLISYRDKKRKVSVDMIQLIKFCDNDFEHSGKCWLFLNISNLSNEILQISDIVLSPIFKGATKRKLLRRINDNPYIKLDKHSLASFSYACVAKLEKEGSNQLFTDKHYGGVYDYLIDWNETTISFPHTLQAKATSNLGLVFTDSHYFVNLGQLAEMCLSIKEYSAIEIELLIKGPELNIKKRIKKHIAYSAQYDKNKTDHSTKYYVI